MSRLVLIGIISILVSPSISTAPGQQNKYGNDEIIAVTRDLAKNIEMPDLKVSDLIRNFKQALDQDWYKEILKGRSITAVFVFRSTEAGLIYKRMSGHGLVSFKGGKKAVPIDLSSSSFGAQIGGSAQWGLGLVIGLKEDSFFGGSYSGKQKGATAVDSTASWGAVFSNADHVENQRGHDIYLIVTGRGFSAGVSSTRVTITPKW